jgi:hypothetical protein
MIGPGKYGRLCTLVRERAHAWGAVVIVFSGNEGDGFSVQAPADLIVQLPDILEFMAREIRADAKRTMN